MASPFRLIRPTGTLARTQGSSFLGPSSILHSSSFSNGRSVTFTSSFEAKRAFSGSAFRNDGNNSNNGNNSSNSKDTVNKSQAQLAEEESARTLAAAAERKRLEAQDAALKEILDSAAAEKKKLEEEARNIAEEKARQAAKEAAEAEAARLAKVKADAQANEAAGRAAAAAEKRSAEQRLQAEQAQAARAQVDSVAAQSSASRESIVGSKDVGKEASSAKLSASSVAGALNGSAPQKGESVTTVSESTSASEPKDDPLEQLKSRLLPYKQSLSSSSDQLRSNVSAGLRDLSDSIKRKDYKETIAQLSEHLNNFTGYNSINELKHKVTTHGSQLDEARAKLARVKQAYEDAIGTRSDTQKAINDLLQRKHLWSPNDVIRFTDLYRSEHANEQAELKSKQEYKQAEANVEEKSRRLTTIIMERYHEEQVWSDKIRAASTYGTWGLIGMNIMAFLMVQGFVEPRRRRKQVERYEELVQDLTERGVLPEKTATLPSSGATPTTIAQANDSTDPEDSREVTPVAVGGALLGGEDVLLRMIQSAERQEERLDRMEDLLRQQIPGTLEKSESEETEEAGEFIVAEDGSILFVANENAGLVDMGESWGEELMRGSISEGKSSSIVIHPSSRFSRVLKDGDVEVVATRRDFLLSGLGGAIIGGLVTLAVMMNR
ncbi:sensitivity to high expression protein she9 [Mortierella hygrophila]|uniref:Sensitive to high expression protein 9, mitochondrial n=1 Tax=Mortierella hygrophila TaxID=979708 RepID=A0A9P6K810_9FUNG|nr:sensitivity to high expression protein she9 [Mortierella hygrophila]